MSDNYLAQIDIKSIGVTLTENGNDVSWRDYKHKDDDWSEATGVLLGDMLKDAGDEKLILDKKYDEKLAVKNSGGILGTFQQNLLIFPLRLIIIVADNLKEKIAQLPLPDVTSYNAVFQSGHFHQPAD